MKRIILVILVLILLTAWQSSFFQVRATNQINELRNVMIAKNIRIEALEAQLAHLIAYPHPVPLPPLQSFQRAPTMRPTLFEPPCALPTAPAARLESPDWL